MLFFIVANVVAICGGGGASGNAGRGGDGGGVNLGGETGTGPDECSFELSFKNTFKLI